MHGQPHIRIIMLFGEEARFRFEKIRKSTKTVWTKLGVSIRRTWPCNGALLMVDPAFIRGSVMGAVLIADPAFIRGPVMGLC